MKKILPRDLLSAITQAFEEEFEIEEKLNGFIYIGSVSPIEVTYTLIDRDGLPIPLFEGSEEVAEINVKIESVDLYSSKSFHLEEDALNTAKEIVDHIKEGIKISDGLTEDDIEEIKESLAGSYALKLVEEAIPVEEILGENFEI